MFIGRVAGDTAAVIPAWMFDAVRCAGMVLGAPRASLVALDEMGGLLCELGFDGPATATHARSQETTDEAETIVPTKPSPDDAAVAAPADVTRRGARPGGARRGYRRARSAAAGGRAARARSGGR